MTIKESLFEIEDELTRSKDIRARTKAQHVRKKEWFNGYIKGLEMCKYLINKHNKQ